MEKVTIKMVNKSTNELPFYATEGSSGMDVRAFISEPVTLRPLERKMIPTGLFVEIPLGYEIQVRPRSGMAWKHGITCLNTPGTIDSDYRGEIKIILVNVSQEEHTIQNGDRIAQLVLGKIETGDIEVVADLEQTERGAGGFGHTGMK